MRRLAPLLFLVSAAIARADGVHHDSGAYLKLRAQNGIVQTVGAAALNGLSKPRVLELSGKRGGTCESGDKAVLILELQDGGTEEVEANAIPEWLATSDAPIRVLVRAEPGPGSPKLTLLDAAPEADILPSEEAYWRRVARKTPVAARAKRPVASRGAMAPRGTVYGPIGRHAVRHTTTVYSYQNTSIYAAYIRRQNPRLTAAEASSIAHDLIDFGLRANVEPRLIVAILMVESGFDPHAVSHSGAVGLGQLMPGTARWMGVQNSYDTTQNLYGMVKLLATLSRQFNRAPYDPIVLAAYNAGDGAVRRHGGVPPYRETQAYVQRVTQIFLQLAPEYRS